MEAVGINPPRGKRSSRSRRWGPVPSARLRLARTLAREIREREGRNLVALGVYGSVARKQDRRHSDLDVVMILRSARAGARFAVRDGTLVTLLRLTRHEARRQVTKGDAGTPERLAGWRPVRALYDPTGFLGRLRARAQRPSKELFREAVREGLLGTYEDLGKLRNAFEAGDPEEAREMAIWFTGGALSILFCLERFVPTTDRRLFIEAKRFGAIGLAIRRLRYEDLPIQRMSVLTESTWKGLRERAARQGVELLADLP
jgi:kanamycin nucleotidyltransferase